MVGQDDDRRLDSHRREIDRIDSELLALLNRRAEHALEIGEIKKKHNAPIFVPEREQAVLERLAAANPGPLTASAVQAVFEAIFEQMKRLEAAESPAGEG